MGGPHSTKGQLPVLGAGGPSPRCWQIRLLLRPPPGLTELVLCPRCPLRPHPWCLFPFPFHKDAGPFGLWPTLWSHLTPVTSFRTLPPNTVTLGMRASIYGGRGQNSVRNGWKSIVDLSYCNVRWFLTYQQITSTCSVVCGELAWLSELSHRQSTQERWVLLQNRLTQSQTPSFPSINIWDEITD